MGSKQQRLEVNNTADSNSLNSKVHNDEILIKNGLKDEKINDELIFKLERNIEHLKRKRIQFETQIKQKNHKPKAVSK